MEATPRLELGVEILQTSALPLGYVADVSVPGLVKRGPCKSEGFCGERRKEPADMELSPSGESGMEQVSSDDLERVTRLELATSTLARWRSTR